MRRPVLTSSIAVGRSKQAVVWADTAKGRRAYLDYLEWLSTDAPGQKEMAFDSYSHRPKLQQAVSEPSRLRSVLPEVILDLIHLRGLALPGVLLELK